MRDAGIVRNPEAGNTVLLRALAGALWVGTRATADRGTQLDQYQIGRHTEIETDLGPRPAVAIYSLKSGWPVWAETTVPQPANSRIF
jgi:hypothetical protein